MTAHPVLSQPGLPTRGAHLLVLKRESKKAGSDWKCCFLRLRNDQRHLRDRLLQEGREGPASCQVDGARVSERRSLHSTFGLLVSNASAEVPSRNCLSKGCRTDLVREGTEARPPSFSFCLPGRLGSFCGRSARCLSSRTKACPTSRCSSSSWTGATWTGQTTAPTDCTFPAPLPDTFHFFPLAEI